jgi:hypothetical protein
VVSGLIGVHDLDDPVLAGLLGPPRFLDRRRKSAASFSDPRVSLIGGGNPQPSAEKLTPITVRACSPRLFAAPVRRA